MKGAYSAQMHNAKSHEARIGSDDMSVNDVADTASTSLFGINFSNATIDTILDHVISHPAPPGDGAQLMVTTNVDHVVLLREHKGLKEAYNNAWIRTIDGMPVLIYSYIRQKKIPGRVTGADFFAKLMERFTPGKYKLFFVVADDRIEQGLRAWAAKHDLLDDIDIAIPPFGFERDGAYGNALADRIRVHRTTHLFFGVGCPRSEIWIDSHRRELGDCYAFAVGAAVGFFAGTIHRAPPIMRQLGLEWIWRMLGEPRRLGPRYLVRSWGFLLSVRDDLMRKAP